MGITLKAARVNKSMTQLEAAKLIGIDKKTLSNYENEITFPDIPVIKKMEEIYGVEYKDIIFFNIT